VGPWASARPIQSRELAATMDNSFFINSSQEKPNKKEAVKYKAKYRA
jgi:hypothetical protein